MLWLVSQMDWGSPLWLECFGIRWNESECKKCLWLRRPIGRWYYMSIVHFIPPLLWLHYQQSIILLPTNFGPKDVGCRDQCNVNVCNVCYIWLEVLNVLAFLCWYLGIICWAASLQTNLMAAMYHFLSHLCLSTCFYLSFKRLPLCNISM